MSKSHVSLTRNFRCANMFFKLGVVANSYIVLIYDEAKRRFQRICGEGSDCMNIKRKLLFAFMIMIMFPCAMLAAVSALMMNYQAHAVEEIYDIETDTFQVLLSNPMQILNKLTRETYNDLVTLAQQNPDELLNPEYTKNINALLEKNYSFLLVRKGEEIVFCGNDAIYTKIKRGIPDYGAYNTEIDGGLYVSGQIPYLLKQYDFLFSDKSAGSVFIITNVNITIPQLKTTLIQGIISIFTTLVVTACILLVWLYQSIAKPITVLKQATNEVKNGNLDFKLEGTPTDEIGELCQDFDEMREHLKEQIDVRIQYEQDLRELISNISHDLKTPLTAIQGYAEGLLDGVANTKEKQEKYLRTIYTKASDMTTLVEELSYYTKIDANTIPYHFEQVELVSYFEEYLEKLGLDLEGKNCTLQFQSKLKEGQQVWLDKEQIKRVVGNIIGNALKYQDKEEGRIDIILHDVETMVEVEIRDNGSGIAKEALPYIFERFYCADVSRSSKKGGTGLGLAIVKKVVVEHGGTVRASSIDKEGTCIYFTLKKVTA